MARILLVDDDDRTVGFIKRGLEAEGHIVETTNNGEDALAMTQSGQYGLIILDRVLPGIEGVEVCRILRRERRDTLVLMLSGRCSKQDKIEGLNSGADDYLAKPFAFDELLARIEALLRRCSGAVAVSMMRVGDLALDPVGMRAWRGEREVALTAKEFRLLCYLMANPGRVISRSRLLNNVWDVNSAPESKIVDVYIRYLRRKIDDSAVNPLIRTVRGFGYQLSA